METVTVQEAHEITVVSREMRDGARMLQRELLLYRAALDIMCTKLEILSNEFKLGEDRTPIDSVQSRIKSIESIVGKMQRRGLPFTIRALEENLQDIAGVRVICPFLHDVYNVADMLLRHDDVHLLQVKDYIKNPKESGYRSLHMIVTVDVCLSDRKQAVPVELQLRTIAMNCWASTEHQLRYKKDFALAPHVAAELKECAEILHMMDVKTQRLADEVLGQKEILSEAE